MMARLLECAVIFVLGTHLAKREVFTHDRISTHWGATKQLLVNGDGGNTLNRPHPLALPAPQGWAVGARYGATPPRTMLRAGTPSGPLREQEDTYYNRSEACPVAEQMFPLAANGLVEATAGSTAWFRIKARAKYDAHHLKSGGTITAFIVPIAPTSPEEERFEGYVGVVRDNFDGTYDVSYEAEVAGTYVVQARIDGQRAHHCRAQDKTPVDSAYQAFCDFDDPVLTVLHGNMDPARCSLLEFTHPNELATPTPVGNATSVTVISRDSFGNTRTGGTTTTSEGHGDGSSDVFLVTLFNEEGYSTQTSSAVQVITAVAGGDVAVDGWFQLEFGGAISRRLSTSASAGEVQQALMGIFGDDDTVNVLVSASKVPSGGVGLAWRTTFLSHLEEWSESPLSVVPAGGDGRTVVSIQKEASEGVYPIEYTLRYPGRYSMIITDARGEFIADGCRVIEATSMDVKPSPSTATSHYLYGPVAGNGLNTTVTAKISPPEPEPQMPVAPTKKHQADPEHFGVSTSLEGLQGTVDLIYGGDDTLSDPFVRSIDVPTAGHRDLLAQTFGGITAKEYSREVMRPANFDVYGNCSVMGAERFHRRRYPNRHYPWSRGIRDRAIVDNTTAVNKFSLADATLDMHSSSQHFAESDGWEVLARRRGWSARPLRPVPHEDHSVYKSDPSVHAPVHGKTVNDVQPAITDVLPERTDVVAEDSGTVVTSPLVQPTREATGSAQERPAGLALPYCMTTPLPTEGRSRGELAARDGPGIFPPRVSLIPSPPDEHDHDEATSETRGSGPFLRTQSPVPEAEIGTVQEEAGTSDTITGTAASSIGEEPSSSGKQSPDRILTRDDTVAEPTALVLPPCQRPAGLAAPCVMTTPLLTEGQSRGELAARDDPGIFPPRVSLIPSPPDEQDHDKAISETRGSGPSLRTQSPVPEIGVDTVQEETGTSDTITGTAASSIGQEPSSSGTESSDRTLTRDDTVAEPTVLVLPPCQRPAGLAAPYGMTALPIGRWGPGGLSTREGPAPHSAPTPLPGQPEGQAQDRVDNDARHSGPLDRRQSSMNEGGHKEISTGPTSSATTPASESSPPPRPPDQDEGRAIGSVPPAALLLNPSERQDHDEDAPTATVGSPASYGSQPPVIEEEAEEVGDGANSRGTTPASLLSSFPDNQSHDQESCVPWAALLPPKCEAGVSLELLDDPTVGAGDGDDAAAASTGSASLVRSALAVAALMILVAVDFNRPAVRWTCVVRRFQAVVTLPRGVLTAAKSFGAAVVLRVRWIFRTVVALVCNAPTTVRSFGARVVERGIRVVEVLRHVRALRYIFAATRLLGGAPVSAAAWVWEETSSECPLDHLCLVLVALWVAKRDIVRCHLANLWNDIWSSALERHECELRLVPKSEPDDTLWRELAGIIMVIAVYFGTMAGFAVYLEIIRPKWISWKWTQRACFEEVAAEAAKAAYRWMNMTPRTTHRRIICPPDQQGLAAAVRVLLSFAENRNLLLAYKRDQDSSAPPPWWPKWSRRWKDRQVLLELAEVLRELWYYVDEVKQDWFYEAADSPLDDLGCLRDAIEKLLGTRARKKVGAELQVFLDVMRRTFSPEEVNFMNCGKSVASSCCLGSDSANHSAPLKIEGQLDIVSADMIWMEYIDNHLTRRSPLFRFLGQRATPRPCWIRWSRACKACWTITPREILGLEPLRLERLPELLYIKMDGDGLRNYQLPDTVQFRAPDSDALVSYAPAALLSEGGGGVGQIAAMRDVTATQPRMWWSPDNSKQDIYSFESSPFFVVLRKNNARR